MRKFVFLREERNGCSSGFVRTVFCVDVRSIFSLTLLHLKIGIFFHAVRQATVTDVDWTTTLLLSGDDE